MGVQAVVALVVGIVVVLFVPALVWAAVVAGLSKRPGLGPESRIAQPEPGGIRL